MRKWVRRLSKLVAPWAKGQQDGVELGRIRVDKGGVEGLYE